MDQIILVNTITLIGVIISLVSIILLYKQLREMQNASLGEFMLRLHDEFFWKHSNAEIVKCIESNKKIFKANGGRFSELDVDNYLGAIELLSMYLQQHILKENIIKHFFGYYIIKTYENLEIKAYIKKCKLIAGPHIYSNIEELAGKFSIGSNH